MLQLLDLAGIYFRAFYAVPASVKGPGGQPTNSVRGTLDIIARVIQDARPTRVIACLDVDWRPAWRVALVPSYKAHRAAPTSVRDTALPGESDKTTSPQLHVDGQGVAEEVPDELSVQVPVLLDVLRAIGIATAGAPGFEADDVIGTLADGERVDPVDVVTGDRDLFQLARDAPTEVRVRYIGGGMSKTELLGASEVAAKHGIPADRYADFAVLRGDPSDGLPGVPGVGTKTAGALISTYGSIEGVMAAVADSRSGLAKAQRVKLEAAAGYLAAAPAVVRVARDAPVTVHPAGDGRLPTEPADAAALLELIGQYGIGGPVKRLFDAMNIGLGG